MTENQITICGHGSGFPSKKNLYSYNQSRYATKAKSNGKRKELVAVRRLKDMTDSQRIAFRNAYTIILGRNYYSQAKREHVFKSLNGYYYSDCSSSGDACYAKAGHDVGWLNTAGIYNSAKFESVPVIIKNGHIVNPDVLKVGDALLYRGEDENRPLQIGHVEYVYEIQEDVWKWVKVGETWYHQSNGRNSYGWKLIKESNSDKKHWYHFDEKGRMEKGVIDDNGKLYYLLESGALEGACCKTDSNGELKVWDV